MVAVPSDLLGASDKITSKKCKTRQLLDTSSNMAASLLSTAMTMYLVLAVSVFLYGTFYYAYMPVELANIPVSLEFEPCEGQTSARCTNPAASVALGNKQKMIQGQVYSIKMVLEVPDLPGNEDLGMFMACMNVTGQDGDFITRSCKSSISQYRSPMLRSIETLALAPSLMVGWTEQKQTIPVTFFATFHPDPHAEVRAFHIEVKSKLVQVAQATLHIEANLTGLRHLMYRHSWFSAFMGIGTNILIFMTIIGVSWTKFRMGGASTTSIRSMSGDAEDQVQSEEADLVEDLGPGPLSGDGDSAPQATSSQPSIANKMKWFLLRQAFKVTIKTAKVTVIVALVVLCYEAAMQGSEANWENVTASTKEDLIALVNILMTKGKEVVVGIMKKYNL